MNIAIIGGGYAGMAAAVSLADTGMNVSVFEAGKVLGGRARRVEYEGIPLDNGQHILIGAYRELLALIDKVHPDPAGAVLHTPLDFSYLAANGGTGFTLRAPNLPAPWHAFFALLFARGLTLGEKFSAMRFMQSIRHDGYRLQQDISVADLLARHKQSATLYQRLWEPLCISALNTPASLASAQVFLNVLRDSLGSGRAASDLLFPRNDLSALFPEPAGKYIQRLGSHVHLGATIRGIHIGSDSRYQLEGDPANGHYNALIVAVAPHRTADLLKTLPQLEPTAMRFDQLDYQAIHTCYLKYPENITLHAPMRGLIGPTGQWVFDRGVISGDPKQRGLFAIIISAEGPHEAVAQGILADTLHAELAALLPDLPAPLWSKVIAEKRATFTCRPNLERPLSTTSLPGLYIANDAIASDYPATLEGAVRAGLAVAKTITATMYER